ncbi:Transcriptional regulator, IclR family [Serinicoccus hydrothermalis]|uniref:Transcriptional regulator, IclR family n=1 Tax=Serinicoccus hydrothermalis TaxID=1758689 RepID=A0A1B1N966_9MICO|nr:IclR family transcriptional regulator [Serinicoccus hydrothermalis]ANS77977.1 Transcriptional regulator, IclR family [Serinicoccus hydrothermalis]
MSTTPAGARAVERTFALLELVADRGGATARELADELGLPLSTVYRLAADLVARDYLLHLRHEGRFELGFKPHRLGLALHRQIGLSAQVRQRVVDLHRATGCAAYLAIRRGATLALVFVADSPECPRLEPMTFGFHEAPHATAFGKILLADLYDTERQVELARHGLPALTPRTITDAGVLEAHLARVTRRGVAWEFEEFLPGSSCAAVAVRRPDGGLLGCVAVSAGAARFDGPDLRIEHRLRVAAGDVAAYFRRVDPDVLTH